MNHFPYAHAASSSSGDSAVLFLLSSMASDDRAEVSSALEKLQKLRRARGMLPLLLGQQILGCGIGGCHARYAVHMQLPATRKQE